MGIFFSLDSTPELYILRMYHLSTLVLISWALNGPLCVVAHQAQSGRITARTSLERKKNYLPASRAGTAWLQPFLHTEMLLGSLRQAYAITAAQLSRFLIRDQSLPLVQIHVSIELEELNTNQFLLEQHATSFPSLFPGDHFDQKKRYARSLS